MTILKTSPTVSLPRRFLRVSGLFVLGCGSSAAGPGAQSALTANGPLSFTIDASRTFPISRYIYGGNFVEAPSAYGGATTPKEFTLNRMGGNRLSAYNWETNDSNAGNDYEFHNDEFLSESTRPGEAVRTRADYAFTRGMAFLATVPMLGHVAADRCQCNVGTSDADRQRRLAAHFRVSRAFKGAPLSAQPNASDAVVAQDEFVHWFEATFPGRSTHPTAPVFFSLDNEVDIWHATHKEVNSDIGDDADKPRLQTYRGLTDTSIEYARAIKSVLPDALVFGPAVATYAGIAVLGRHPVPDPEFGRDNFTDIYLQRMKVAEVTHGRRLLDVLDVHYYPAIGTRGGEITNDFAPQDSATVWARVQGPRSLWDPAFDEKSWVSGVTNGPVMLLRRLKSQIAAHYPGTKLSVSEYYFGRGGDISGGIAQADALGIFGREGVFAAMFWPQAGLYAQPWKGDGAKAYAYVFGALKMFRNYDGAGGTFGDTGLAASTSNAVAATVYASRDAKGRVVVVAINKTRAAQPATIAVNGVTGVTTARSWAITSASALPIRQSDPVITAATTVTVTLPAMSVSTIVLAP